MDKYELTTLWQNTLGLKNQTNGYQEQVDFLRQAYYSLRQKAQLFASEINEALKWYQKSADNGYESAKLKIQKTEEKLKHF